MQINSLKETIKELELEKIGLFDQVAAAKAQAQKQQQEYEEEKLKQTQVDATVKTETDPPVSNHTHNMQLLEVRHSKHVVFVVVVAI